jgi:hypothetical protein
MGGVSLFQQSRIESLVDFVLMRRIAIVLKGRDESPETGCEDDQVPRGVISGIGVRNSRGDEYGVAGAGGLDPVGVAEYQFALQDVPCFVVGIVDVERRRSTAAPLVDLKRCSGR